MKVRIDFEDLLGQQRSEYFLSKTKEEAIEYFKREFDYYNINKVEE